MILGASCTRTCSPFRAKGSIWISLKKRQEPQGGQQRYRAQHLQDAGTLAPQQVPKYHALKGSSIQSSWCLGALQKARGRAFELPTTFRSTTTGAFHQPAQVASRAFLNLQPEALHRPQRRVKLCRIMAFWAVLGDFGQLLCVVQVVP